MFEIRFIIDNKHPQLYVYSNAELLFCRYLRWKRMYLRWKRTYIRWKRTYLRWKRTYLRCKHTYLHCKLMYISWKCTYLRWKRTMRTMRTLCWFFLNVTTIAQYAIYLAGHFGSWQSDSLKWRKCSWRVQWIKFVLIHENIFTKPWLIHKKQKIDFLQSVEFKCGTLVLAIKKPIRINNISFIDGSSKITLFKKLTFRNCFEFLPSLHNSGRCE